jgi:hypothetical protein
VHETRVRAAAMSAIALTLGSCVRRDDLLKRQAKPEKLLLNV